MTTAGEVKDDDMMGEPGLIGNPSREELEAKLTEAEDKILRARAEIENLHRRSERDITDAHKYGIKKLLEELIPILDSLEQGLAVQGTEHDMVKSMRDGMELTLRMLQKVLEKFGVKEIHPLNEMFNPAFHEVMLAQEKTDVAPNTIIQVMQKGYQLHDRVIRPARVMIAKAA
ncbi:MAG TPA: nucleotide exchange factor GrpE [Gammaproteobacteria bacterium]|nr:nucleotide exchange factor GrpE [Gammaproteobacteria bacterium]